MMNVYLKLMSDPETKDLITDPSFMPIMQELMTNPAQAAKYMTDPRVQKVLKVLQSSYGKDDL